MKRLVFSIIVFSIYQLPCSGQSDEHNTPANVANPNARALSNGNESKPNASDNDSIAQQDPNWIIAKLTGALVIVGMLQVFVYWRQARLMREAINQSRVSSEAQLRAYICVDTQATDPECMRQFTEALEQDNFLVFVENTGQTPAYDVECQSTWTYFPGRSTEWPANVRFKTVEELRAEDNGVFGSKSVIGAGHRGAYRCAGNPQKDGTTFGQALEKAVNEKLTIYIYGTITYRDAFSKTIRFTEFCANTFVGTATQNRNALGFSGYHAHHFAS